MRVARQQSRAQVPRYHNKQARCCDCIILQYITFAALIPLASCRDLPRTSAAYRDLFECSFYPLTTSRTLVSPFHILFSPCHNLLKAVAPSCSLSHPSAASLNPLLTLSSVSSHFLLFSSFERAEKKLHSDGRSKNLQAIVTIAEEG